MDTGQLEPKRHESESYAQEQPRQIAAPVSELIEIDALVGRLLDEIRLLRQELAQARTAIFHKDELIMEWIASAQAWKALSVALREEGQETGDRQQHPLAHDPAQRNRIYREVRRTAHARLKAQIYPPTSWRPK